MVRVSGGLAAVDTLVGASDYNPDNPEYGDGCKVLGKTNYAALQSGEIEVGGRKISTAPASGIGKAREIALLLKERIRSGNFLLTEPVKPLPEVSTVKKLTIRDKE